MKRFGSLVKACIYLVLLVIRTQLWVDLKPLSHTTYQLQPGYSIEKFPEACAFKSDEYCAFLWNHVLSLAVLEFDRALREKPGTADWSVQSVHWVDTQALYTSSQHEQGRNIFCLQECLLKSDEPCALDLTFLWNESSPTESRHAYLNVLNNNDHSWDSQRESRSQTHTEQHGQLAPQEGSMHREIQKKSSVEVEEEKVDTSGHLDSQRELQSHIRLHTDHHRQIASQEGNMARLVHKGDYELDEGGMANISGQMDNHRKIQTQTRLHSWLTPHENIMETERHEINYEEDENERKAQSQTGLYTDQQGQLTSQEGNMDKVVLRENYEEDEKMVNTSMQMDSHRKPWYQTRLQRDQQRKLASQKDNMNGQFQKGDYEEYEEMVDSSGQVNRQIKPWFQTRLHIDQQGHLACQNGGVEAEVHEREYEEKEMVTSSRQMDSQRNSQTRLRTDQQGQPAPQESSMNGEIQKAKYEKDTEEDSMDREVQKGDYEEEEQERVDMLGQVDSQRQPQCKIVFHTDQPDQFSSQEYIIDAKAHEQIKRTRRKMSWVF